MGMETDANDLADAIFNQGRRVLGQVRGTMTVTMTGTALTDSEAGYVTVWVDGLTVSDEQGARMPCVPAVRAGQRVIITVVGNDPTVTGVIGSGDETKGDIDKVATETGQNRADIQEAQRQQQETSKRLEEIKAEQQAHDDSIAFIKRQQDAVDKKIEDVVGDIDSIDGELDAANKRIDESAARLQGNIDKVVSDTRKTVEAIDGKISAADSKAQDALNKYTALSDAVKEAGKRQLYIQPNPPLDGEPESEKAGVLWIDTTDNLNVAKQWGTVPKWTVEALARVTVGAAAGYTAAQLLADSDAKGWVSIADARIQDAADKAVLAQQTADGKNRIEYSYAEPGHDGLSQGDQWWVVDAVTGDVTDIMVWNGGRFVPYQIVADSILVPSSVGPTLIADGSISTQKITAHAITTELIESEAVTAGQIAGLSITSDKIAAKAVTADKMLITNGSDYCPNPQLEDAGPLVGKADGSAPASGGRARLLDGRDMAFPYSTAFSVQAGEEYLVSFEAMRSKGSKALNAGLWVTRDGNSMAPDVNPWLMAAPEDMGAQSGGPWHLYYSKVTVPGASKASRQVNRAQVYFQIDQSDGSTAWRVGNVHCRRMSDAELIVNGSITAKKLAVGAVTAESIAAGAVTASKLTVTNLSNILVNGSFEDGLERWAQWSGAKPTFPGGRTGGVCASASRASAQWGIASEWIATSPGESFRAVGYFRVGSNVSVGNGFMKFEYADSAGATHDLGTAASIPGNGWTWTRHTAQATVPAGVSRVRVSIGFPKANENVSVDDVQVMRMADAELTVDGSITARKIDVKGLSAALISAGQLVAGDPAKAHITISGEGITGYGNDGKTVTSRWRSATGKLTIGTDGRTLDQIDSTAAQARSLAGNANSLASTANGAANSAAAAAGSAQKAADNAKKAADGAQASANSAQSAATSAYNEAKKKVAQGSSGVADLSYVMDNDPAYGLRVGCVVGGKLTFLQYLQGDRMQIRLSDQKTVVAEYGTEAIKLGMVSTTSSIQMCSDTFEVNADYRSAGRDGYANVELMAMGNLSLWGNAEWGRVLARNSVSTLPWYSATAGSMVLGASTLWTGSVDIGSFDVAGTQACAFFDLYYCESSGKRSYCERWDPDAQPPSQDPKSTSISRVVCSGGTAYIASMTITLENGTWTVASQGDLNVFNGTDQTVNTSTARPLRLTKIVGWR